MKDMKLTKYEREIVEAIESGNVRSIANLGDEKKRLQKIAQNQFKDKMISLRLPEASITALKEKAGEAGVPYQRIISMLIHQYNQGKVNLKI
jgi:predicted DNA binding CopG/RHH family protein